MSDGSVDAAPSRVLGKRRGVASTDDVDLNVRWLGLYRKRLSRESEKTIR